MLDRLKAALSDRYAIERELGSGGMATVYLAQDLKLRRKVALKVLRPELAEALGPDRFRQEIDIAAKLNHPHILGLYDCGEADGFLYYVMPYVEGQSLRDRIARERELPIHDVIRTLHDVADALAHAHSRNVIHRDIKPDNVMLSDRHALVTDFGIAKALSEATGAGQLTTVGIALGTPSYMAPEQAAADPHVDHRADIYAMGALAYEMLTGRPPFTGNTQQEILAAQVTKLPEPVTTYRKSVPPALEQLVLKCLEKKAADRWQNAGELLQQLETIATPSSGVTPTGSQPVAAAGADPSLRRNSPARVASLYTVVSAAVLVVTYAMVMLLGLPYWVLLGAVVVLAMGVPHVLLTGRAERRRATERMTGLTADTVGSRPGFLLTWRWTVYGGGSAVAALVLLTASYSAMRSFGIGPAGTLMSTGVLEERDRIVMAQFEDLAGDPELTQTVTDLIRIDVSLSPAIVLVEPPQVEAVLRRMMREPGEKLTVELAREVAEREGMKAILAGELVSVGSGYTISGRLMEASTGNALWAARERARGKDEIMAAVDRLSAKLREKVGESLRSIRAEPPPWRYSTYSLEALRKYTEAVRVNDEGDFESAIALLEEAVELDSLFAMAYRKLGVIINNTGGDLERTVTAVTKAYELRDRLTDRERYLVEEIFEAGVNLDPQASITALRRLLEQYPDDRIGLSNLGRRYLSLRRWEDAEANYGRLVDLGYAGFVAYTGLIRAQVAQGKYDAADSTWRQLHEAFPENVTVAAYQARIAGSRGNLEAVRTPLLQALETNRGNRLVEGYLRSDLAYYDLAEGKLTSADRHALEWAAAEHARGTSPAATAYRIADLHVGIEATIKEDLESADSIIQDVLLRHPVDTMDVEDRPYLTIVNMYSIAGQPDRARAWLSRYEAEASERSRHSERLDYHVARGNVAAAAGRFDEAIADFREAYDLSGSPISQLFNLGKTFDRAGEADSAIAYFKAYVDTPYLYKNRGTAQARVYRSLGALYEERNQPDSAVYYYNEFVELWKDADADLQPLVQDVRERMARLVGER